MPKLIQIRNVPGDPHRRLKSRAAQAGMSLSDYLLNEDPRDLRAAYLGGVPRPPGDAIADKLAALAGRDNPRVPRSRVIVVDASALAEVLLRRPALAAVMCV